MKKSILNEINEMKYLFGYKRGVVISEQVTGDTNSQVVLTPENVRDQLGKLVRQGIEYFGGNLITYKTIAMTSEFETMNTNNKWNYPTRIETDFSSVTKLELPDDQKQKIEAEYNLTIGTSLLSDYTITFKYISQDGNSLFPDNDLAKIKTGSVYIKCKSGNNNLIIYQNPNNTWYYITFTFK